MILRGLRYKLTPSAEQAGFPFSSDTGELFVREHRRPFDLQVAGTYLILSVGDDLLCGEYSAVDVAADRMVADAVAYSA